MHLLYDGEEDTVNGESSQNDNCTFEGQRKGKQDGK